MNLEKHLTLSNLIFAVAVALLVYKPTRIWCIRQVSYGPAIENVSEEITITNYNWELKGLNTLSNNLKTYEGKVVFLNFWATWCSPCVAELPSIQDFYNAYKDKVAFVFVTSENWHTVQAFFIEHGYEFKVYNAASALPKGWPEVNVIPTTFIIDKKGHIRVHKTGAADWNSRRFRESIDRLLND